MALLDRIDPDYRARVVEAFITDRGARRARAVWLTAIVLVVVLWTLFLAWREALELFHFLFIAPGAVFLIGVAMLRTRPRELRIALSGHGFSDAERGALCIELEADPEVRAAIAERASSLLQREGSRYRRTRWPRHRR